MNSCCIYRLPKSQKNYCYKGESRKGLLPGFVIAPFDLGSDIYTITDLSEATWQDLKKIISESNDADLLFQFPSVSTTEEQHFNVVNGIKKLLNGDLSRKIIASKVIVKSGTINLEDSFNSLCNSFPEAFVFIFHTPQSGTWIGASPELLLKCENSVMSTCALAGTRPAGSLGDWDDKNTKEQAIVKDYIVDIFRSFGLDPNISETTTRRAGSVEHLLNEINTHVDASNNIENLLKALSPTPALAGYPKDMAMSAIQRLERHPRGFYGGFFGPLKNSDDFNFYVNLRSIRLDTNRYCMHVGGGITSLSVPEEEWGETERKAKSILSAIKLKN